MKYEKLFGFFVFVLAIALAGSVWAQAKPQTCLSYMQVGSSSCQNGVSKTEIDEAVLIPTPPIVNVQTQETSKTVVQAPSKPTLDDKIDEYMENYGKPPREFVAFNLEPTIENAVKWAKKYRELMERNQKLTAAWGQAQTILDDLESKGQPVPGFEPMAEVPDYGVPLPNRFKNYSDQLPSQRNDYQAIATNSNSRQGAPTLGFAEEDTLNSGGSLVVNRRDEDAVNMGAQKLFGESVTPPSALREGPIEISYYFSAECPFCKKFEVGFKQLIKDMGDELKVTCVDMTPTERTRSNIHGKIDCSWRAAIPGEAKALGVQSTPTLIINRQIGKGLEKVEGVVDIDKLKAFLLGVS